MRVWIVSLLCFWLLVKLAHAQEQIHFEHFSTENGLSDNFINALSQDGRGFLWCATQYGLNRFDGQDFRVYTDTRSRQLLRNDFNCLTLAPNGQIIAGGYNGVVQAYNQQRDDFDDISLRDVYDKKYVSVLRFQTIGGVRYALTTSGVYCFDAATQTFSNTLPAFKNAKNLVVNALRIDAAGRFWLATRSGLYVFDGKGELLAHYFDAVIEVFDLLPLPNGLMLIATAGAGLWQINCSTVGGLPAQPQLLNAQLDASCFLLDSKQRLWVGTRSKGIWYRAATGGFVHIEPYQTANWQLMAISCLFESNDGSVWAGTFGSGLWCYRYASTREVLLSKNIGLSTGIVSGFAQDADGRLWVTSDGEGVWILSPQLQVLKHINSSTGLFSSGIQTIVRDAQKRIWVSTWGGGVSSIDPKQYAVQNITSFNSKLPVNNAKALCFDNKGMLWIGTHGEGICQYNSQTKTLRTHFEAGCEHFMMSPYQWINQLLAARDGGVWVATIHSVCYVNQRSAISILADTASVPLHNPLAINAIASDAQGNVLVASNRGVYEISAADKKYKALSFLPRGEYVALCFDAHGRLWMSGTTGILCVDRATSSYWKLNGLEGVYAGKYFTPRAAYCSLGGTVYFGGVDGFVAFSPDSLLQNPTIESLSFSDLYRNGQRVLPASDDLPRELSTIDTLTLSYNKTNIRIGVAVVCFSRSAGVHCAYKLEGLDKEWISIDTKREIAFSQIQPGTYRLLLKAWGGASQQLQKQTSLYLVVSPPWWKTWWFRLLVILVISAGVVLLFYYRLRQMVKRNELLEKTVSERTEALLLANTEITQQNQSLNEKQYVIQMRNEELQHSLETKDRLISVIAHDLKNPLGALVGLLDLLQLRYEEYSDAKRRTMLANSYQSAIRLQDEMLKLLEWASSQMRSVVYAPSDTDLRFIVTETIDFLKDIAANKDIQITSELLATHYAFVDGRMIATVVRNLLSNAIKFTPQGGSISVMVLDKADAVCVVIRDSGVGMTEQQLAAVFDRDSYNSTFGTNNEKGTGLGLKICLDFISKNNGKLDVESVPEQGTNFSIQLPISHKIPDAAMKPQSTPQPQTSSELVIDCAILEGNTILLIDDNVLVRQHLREIIGESASIIESSDGLEGFALTQQKLPDIIICDIDMPLMDGLQLCKAVASDKNTAHIPVILLTAKTGTESRLQGLVSGAVDYLCKPVNKSELLLKLLNQLTIRRNQQQRIISQRFELTNTTATAHRAEPINPFLSQLMLYIEQQYTNPSLSIEELAQAMAVSQATLSRRLSSMVNKTPLELLNEHRLHRGRQLLLDGQLTVSEVAYEVGFNDARYFSRKFKELFGETPSQSRGE